MPPNKRKAGFEKGAPRRSRSKGPVDQPLPDAASAAAAAADAAGEKLAVGPEPTTEMAMMWASAQSLPPK
eukprot:6572006-Alexandrium_andersonii.AAC.1